MSTLRRASYWVGLKMSGLRQKYHVACAMRSLRKSKTKFQKKIKRVLKNKNFEK
jgi:hypothetical protein